VVFEAAQHEQCASRPSAVNIRQQARWRRGTCSRLNTAIERSALARSASAPGPLGSHLLLKFCRTPGQCCIPVPRHARLLRRWALGCCKAGPACAVLRRFKARDANRGEGGVRTLVDGSHPQGNLPGTPGASGSGKRVRGRLWWPCAASVCGSLPPQFLTRNTTMRSVWPRAPWCPWVCAPAAGRWLADPAGVPADILKEAVPGGVRRRDTSWRSCAPCTTSSAPLKGKEVETEGPGRSWRPWARGRG